MHKIKEKDHEGVMYSNKLAIFMALFIAASTFSHLNAAEKKSKLDRYYPLVIDEYTRRGIEKNKNQKTLSASYQKIDSGYANYASISVFPAKVGFEDLLRMDKEIFLSTFFGSKLKSSRKYSFKQKNKSYAGVKFVYVVPADSLGAPQDVYMATYFWYFKNKYYKFQINCLYEDRLQLHKTALVFLDAMQWRKS